MTVNGPFHGGLTCAEPGIFVRGGGSRSISQKSSDNVFFFFVFFFFFFLLFLFFCSYFESSAYFTEVKWLLSKKTIIFQGFRGGRTFSRGGGGPTFSRGGGGGSTCLFPIETHTRRMAENGFAPPQPREFCRHILSCRKLKDESFKRCLHSVLRGVSL